MIISARVNTRNVRPAVLSLLCLWLVGCGLAARADRMTPGVSPAKQHPTSVSVAVNGGNKTNPLWTSEIAGEDFRTALIDSINASRLFTAVTADQPDMNLTVTLIKTIVPSSGMTMTSTVVAQWHLARVTDSAMVADEYIVTPFEAGPFDALLAVERVRAANEGAARANIVEGLRRLSDLTIESPRK